VAANTSAFDLAAQLHRAGRLFEAERAYRSLLSSDPSHFEAMHGLGVLYLQRGLPGQGEELLRGALQVNPQSAAVAHDYGLCLRALGRHAEAAERFEKCVALAPESAKAAANLGRSLLDIGLVQEAIASLDRAIAIDPRDISAHYLRGNALLRIGRAAEAIASFDAAIALSPDHFEALLHRGNAFRELDLLQESLQSYKAALDLRPNDAIAQYNHALALHDAGQLDTALQGYNRAVALAPDFHEARKARGTLRLLRGEFEKGWSDFEARLGLSDPSLLPAFRAIRYWTGEDLQARSIAIYGDGAFGDLIQFSRYIPLLARRGARVALIAPPQFHLILASLELPASICAELDGVTDFRCEVMSLPFLFNTSLQTIPPCQQIKAADQARIESWSSRLPKDRLNVGVCWQGNPQRHIDRGRSIPLAQFFPLSRVPGVRLVSLQKRHGLEQLRELPSGMTVETLGDEFDSGPDAFVDAAAVIANLDLVVTSDTAIAHLAAAAGRPTWIALRFVPEWRWMLDKADSGWYPTVRLFRQRRPGDWAPVFEEIASAAQKCAQERLAGRA
jgi:tetratricopeptide (TPR) repeat protein